MLVRLLAFISISVLLAACAAQSRTGEAQLTPDEVRATFIGTPWHSPGGAFLFRKDGTYTYQEHGLSTPRGTWTYVMKEDGKLLGGNTSYTFYKGSEGYRYYHSRTGRYYQALPNQTAPFVPVATVTISSGNAYSFLGPGDLPLHIGDGDGELDDIEREFREHQKKNPPQHATWTFNVDHPLTTLHLSIRVYSTIEKGHFDCPTVLELNGTQILDFRELSGAGSWKTVVADISVKGDQIRTGANEITVREVRCVGMNAWNDSVITSVGLKAE